MSLPPVQIEESWKAVLAAEFEQPYFSALRSFIRKEKEAGKTIYPPGALLFKAFALTPFEAVKVVIFGQDPYHQQGQAMGLSFSVPRGIKPPPSLVNIYKELSSDIQGFTPPTHGDLTVWAEQGVFLLNALLSVEANRAASHRNIGWESFTDAVIRRLNEGREGLVFMLWGNFAKEKRKYIDPQRHLILEAAHPSPLAGNAFQGCAHFSKANTYLQQRGQTPIDWSLQA